MAAIDGLVDEKEKAYLQYIADEKRLKLSNHICFHKNGAITFYGQRAVKKNSVVSEECFKKLGKLPPIYKIKALSCVFDFLSIFEELPKYKNLQKKSTPETTFLFKTLEKLDITDEQITLLLGGIDPFLVCSVTGQELKNDLLSLPSIDKKKASEILRHFDNSYEIYCSSVKKISRIRNINIEDAISIHRHFSAL